MSAAHVVADIHFGESNGPSWLVCKDGTRLTAKDPETLGLVWQRHGGSLYGGNLWPSKKVAHA